MDLATGVVKQITWLPPAKTTSHGTCCPFFDDDQTITFQTRTDADGTNPDEEPISVTIKTDGSGLTVAPRIAVPGAQVVATFQITGAAPIALILRFAGTPVNPGGLGAIDEVFLVDGHNLLQLTNFRREDTFSATVDGRRVLFTASANPPELGTNPTNNCQIFSIDRNGGDLRQLTDFHEGVHSINGCHSGPPRLHRVRAGAGPAQRLAGLLLGLRPVGQKSVRQPDVRHVRGRH